MSYRSLGTVALLATLVAPGAALAAPAIATANVNLRAGPSTGYPVVDVVGAHHNVEVIGCLSSRSWCDVSYRGHRGWMSSHYLAFAEGGRRYTGAGAVTALHAPVITFSFGSYWDDHYRGRSFYRDRDRWEHDRRDRDHWERDRRERRDVRDARREVREERRELRRARKDLRQERRAGENIREERREVREERRELRDARRWLREERRDRRN